MLDNRLVLIAIGMALAIWVAPRIPVVRDLLP